MDNAKECHVRHEKVHICTCSRCGGTGSVLVGHAVTVCPECLGNGMTDDKSSEGKSNDETR